MVDWLCWRPDAGMRGGSVGNEPAHDGLLKRIEFLEARLASQDRSAVRSRDGLSVAEREDEIGLLRAQATGLEKRLSHAKEELAAIGPRRRRGRGFLGGWLAR